MQKEVNGNVSSVYHRKENVLHLIGVGRKKASFGYLSPAGKDIFIPEGLCLLTIGCKVQVLSVVSAIDVFLMLCI